MGSNQAFVHECAVIPAFLEMPEMPLMWYFHASPATLFSIQVTVDIPDQFLQHLVPAGRDAACSLLEESVAGAYRDGRLTMEQVRQLLGFGTRMQADAFLQQHEIYDYTVEGLDKDMATLNRLLPTKAE
jgi:hypothetical protein